MKKSNHSLSALLKTVKGTANRLFYIIKLVWDTSRFLLIGMILISLLEGALPLLHAFISGNLINALVDAFGTKSSSALQPILQLLLLQFAYLILSRTSTQLKNTLTRLSGEMVTNHIKIQISQKTKEIDLACYDDPDFFEQLENANREASSRPITILSATLGFFSHLISTVSFILLLGALHPLFPIGLILLALPSAIINFKYKKVTFRYIKEHTTDRRRMHYFTNALTNREQVKEIKLLGLHDEFIARYKKAFAEYFKGLRTIFIREDVLHILVHLVTTIFNCGFFVFIAYRVCFGDMKVGDYTLYTGALTSVLSGVSAIVANSSKIYEGTLFIDNMIEFMQVRPKILPIASPAKHPTHDAQHTIEFRNVSFSYPGMRVHVIDNLNLTLQGGKSYALVGLNGAGKTTLIKLMTRLYDPTKGEILLDGINIKEYAVNELYSIFGIVFQDFAKYAVTARENITFGDLHTPYSEERFQSAVEKSGVESLLTDLPEGYDTPLMRFFEKDATDLSGGQWQKVAIARAFYKNAEILILDEPTAALDPIAEADIFRKFDALRSGKTTLFVSHRLSSATTADEIIVMQHGKILEQGDHKTLMQKKGAYYSLFTLQAEKYRENTQNDA